MSIAAGVRLAIGTLTIIPVGEINPLPPRAGRVAMLIAPLAVLPIAAIAGLTLWAGFLVGLPPIVAAALALGVLALLTRAMHLDGLADCVDGAGGGWTRERALDIMKRGDVGPMGVTALVLTLLIQAGSLATMSSVPWAGILAMTSICVSRCAATLVCVHGVRAAREGGMGAVVAGSVPRPLALLALILNAAALSGAGVVAGLDAWWGVAASAAAFAAVVGFLGLAKRKFGGVSGDVIGAAIEISLTVILVVLSIGVAA